MAQELDFRAEAAGQSMIRSGLAKYTGICDQRYYY